MKVTQFMLVVVYKFKNVLKSKQLIHTSPEHTQFTAQEDRSGSRGAMGPLGSGIGRAGSEPVPGFAHACPPVSQRPGLGVLLGGRRLLPGSGKLL